MQTKNGQNLATNPGLQTNYVATKTMKTASTNQS